VSYAAPAGRAPATAHPLSLLPFLAVALLLAALRLSATFTALAVGSGGRPQAPTTQTWVLAAAWVAAYLLEAVAGWRLWRRRARPYGRAALVVFWIQVGIQGLRLLNLLGSRLTAGQVPWSAFGTVVLLDVVAVVGVLTAWQVSRAAGVLLALVLGWALYITALTGADALLQYGLPLT
jgi:tryptophan-rich sensory protein